MNLFRNRAFLVPVAFLAGLAFTPVAFVAGAAGSHFHDGKCGGVPQVDWKFDALCQDAQAVMWGAGLFALALLAVTAWSWMRLRHV